MPEIPAVTLWQPWASAIAARLKRIETRSWAPPAWLIGKRMAIHAAKKPVSRSAMGFSEHWERDAMDSLGVWLWDRLPLGAVVCTVKLARAQRVERVADGFAYFDGPGSRVMVDRWGDFSVGRWLWFLEDIEALEKPFKCKGGQGIWRCELPEGAKGAA
jgi:hypothetical protein